MQLTAPQSFRITRTEDSCCSSFCAPGTLRIADRDYTDELADKTSTQYLELFNELRPLVSCERTCCAIISCRSLRRQVSLAYFTSDWTQLLKTYKSNFSYFQILSIVQSTLNSTRVFVADMTFSAGSVMVDYTIHVTDATSEDEVEAIFDSLVVAAENGELGNFTVDSVQVDTCKS